MSEVKGFKVFNPDWTCRGFQYEVGQTHEQEQRPSVCDTGFHFCKEAKDCFNYYRFDPNNKVAEVIALGAVDEEVDKCSTNKLQIVREISWSELLSLVNLGKGNSGRSNSGDSNSGDSNSGDSNSGDSNSGDSNSGDSNSGHWNSGDSNSGRSNSGDSNSGDSNTGDSNSGNWNSGDWNQGDFCTGDFNMTDHVSGCFCIEEHKLMFFDKETDMTFREWRRSEAYGILCRIPFEPTSKAFLTWWDSLSNREKEIIKSIPNFNAEKFFEITGIRV